MRFVFGLFGNGHVLLSAQSPWPLGGADAYEKQEPRTQESGTGWLAERHLALEGAYIHWRVHESGNRVSDSTACDREIFRSDCPRRHQHAVIERLSPNRCLRYSNAIQQKGKFRSSGVWCAVRVSFLGTSPRAFYLTR